MVINLFSVVDEYENLSSKQLRLIISSYDKLGTCNKILSNTTYWEYKKIIYGKIYSQNTELHLPPPATK